MNAQDMREKNETELRDELSGLLREQFNLRMQTQWVEISVIADLGQYRNHHFQFHFSDHLPAVYRVLSLEVKIRQVRDDTQDRFTSCLFKPF